MKQQPSDDDPNKNKNKPPMDYFAGESEEDDDSDTIHHDDDEEEDDDEENFLRKELAHLEALEEILAELDEAMGDIGDDDDDDDINNFYDEHANGDDDDEDEDWAMWTEDSLSELFSTLEEEDEGEENIQSETPLETTSHSSSSSTQKISTKSSSDRTYQTSSTTSPATASSLPSSSLANLERALSQGVVPVSAGVGTDCLPGDFGFDPLHLADKDYFYQIQSALLQFLPASSSTTSSKTDTPSTRRSSTTRPKALILRDYREAEIRHSRLAMLAAIVWPLQEMLDKFLLPDQLFGPLVYGPVTLPYFPLAMTLILLLLGYLDIYSQAIKDMDQIGDAYLPGDCFWDPLNVLPPADATMSSGNSSDANANLDGMKRRMQERELFNGRAAMMAVLAYTWEEAVTHQAIIDLPGNKVLFTPIYQLPMVQEWLDCVFSDTIR